MEKISWMKNMTTSTQEQPAPLISTSSAIATTYVTHVTVIDTKTGKEAQDRTVVISGDRNR